MKHKRRTEEDRVSSLEKQIRELKAENRQLHKRLGRVTKGYKAFLDREPLKEEPLQVTESIKYCFNCQKGQLIKKEFLGRYYRECNICEKRTKTKIIS